MTSTAVFLCLATFVQVVIIVLARSDHVTAPYHGNSTASPLSLTTSAARKPKPGQVSVIMDSIAKTSMGSFVTANDADHDSEEDDEEEDDDEDSDSDDYYDDDDESRRKYSDCDGNEADQLPEAPPVPSTVKSTPAPVTPVAPVETSSSPS